MASATTAMSDSATRKSLLPVALLFKTAPVAVKETATAGTGNSDQSAPRFADALKAARRPATERAERPQVDERAHDRVSDVDDDPQTDAASETQNIHRNKGADHKPARRPEKSSQRRDHDDAAPDAPAQDAGSNLAAPDEPPVASGDEPASPENDTTNDDLAPADADAATQATPDPTAIIAAQQIAVPVTVPTTADQPAAQTPEASADATTEAPKPTVAQQPGPQPISKQQGETPKSAESENEPESEQQTKPEAKPELAADAKVAPAAEKKSAVKSSNQPPPGEAPSARAPSILTTAAPAEESQHAAAAAAQLQPSKSKSAAHSQQADRADNAPQAAAGIRAPLPIPSTLQTADAAPSQPAPSTEQDTKIAGSATGITITAATAPASARAEGADLAPAAQETPAPDPDQTFEQVVMGLRGKLDARTGKAEIRLEPPNLGPLHVSLHLKNGSLTAQFQSSSDVVRDLLKSNMEKLKSVLEGQGIAVDKLAVGTVESSSDKVVTQATKLPNAGTPNNDGRSAGQYHRDSGSGQKRSPNGHLFGKVWREATADAPIDLVG